ncbi:MAG: transcriptional regulator [Bacteroidota bacterium]
MGLSKDFKSTVQERALTDPEFRKALLTESIECMLAGDVQTGKSILRDYINATIGFQELALITEKKPESLMRMLSPKGNPNAANLFKILSELQKREGIELEVSST